MSALSLGAFALLAIAYARNVYGAYLATGLVDRFAVIILLRYVAAEFLIFSIMITLLWGTKARSRVATLLLLAAFSGIQFTQYQVMAKSDSFLTTDMLQMVGAYEYGATTSVIGLFAVCLILSGLVCYFGMEILRICKITRANRIIGAALVAALALALMFAPRGWRESMAERRHGLTAGSPVVSMVSAWGGFLKGQSAPEVVLEAADRELALSYGIPLAPDSRTPLRRSSFSTHPLPFDRNSALKQPNVILLLLESFTATLLQPYGNAHEGLTPNLNAMAQISMRVDNYFNHTTPTIRGISGQLCSTFPYYSHEEWDEAETKLRTSKLQCIPHVLEEQGYHTASLTYMTPGETYIGTQLADFGFRELYFRHRLMRDLVGPPHSPDAFPGDQMMFLALIKYLENWQREQPLFITVTTVETHTGWIIRNVEDRYGDGTNQVLNTLHNLDRQFGMFWDWFQKSRYFENTVLVVTGDHAIYPHDAVRRAASPGYENRELARMGLFIYDPAHQLPPSFEARTSSIDLAPSLLHLIGATDRENPFVGVSMFADRVGLRGGPGYCGSHVLLWENGTPEVASVGTCDEGSDQEHRCRLLRIVKYLEWLERSNRVWFN